MQEPIISVSGLRGIIGKSLTPQIALRFAVAFAAELPPGPIVISRDGRDSGPMLAAAVQAGLAAVGRCVLDGGIAATPTTGVLVREQHAAGGIQISASHNPPEYNGMKLFSAAGRVIPKTDGERVIESYRQGLAGWVSHDRLGAAQPLPDTVSRHLNLVLDTVNVDRIRQQRFRVLLDSNHGAGCLLGRRLLDALGCETVVLGETADGRFEHPPEPTSENLGGVLEQVALHHAAIGFCQDPDADRLAVIDERGRYLGEEYTLAICVDHLLRQRRGAIVTNCSTSRMSQDLAMAHGVPFFHASVGEANVVDTMLRYEALLGGEGNGGVIDPRVGLVRDSFSGMALLLDAMAQRAAPISQLADELPRYEIVKTKMELAPERMATAFRRLEACFADAKINRMDGLRFDWNDRWLLVRASNTEPIVRAIAEAKSASDASRLCELSAQALAGG